MNLTEKKCVACEGGTPPMTPVEISLYLPQVPEWSQVDGKLHREWTFSNFVTAMKFVNAVAVLAESEQHHPDIAIWYNKVVLDLMTHAVHGLSENDFILAAKISALPEAVV